MREREGDYKDIALQQLKRENLGEPNHIIIHVGTNDLRAQQERVADSVTRVAIVGLQIVFKCLI